MSELWSGFSYVVINLARFVRPDEITVSGVNSTLPMLACLLAKRAYPFDFIYINVAGAGAYSRMLPHLRIVKFCLST